MRIFVSAEDIDDPLALSFREALSADAWTVDHSPRNPRRGEDPRWEHWYGSGCLQALARADVFVAVATDGWDGSTWMATEAEVALDQGLQPFLWNPDHVSIPLGMCRYAEQPLDDSIVSAIRQLAAHRAASPPLIDRHLRRLFRFLKRLPGCPNWSGVLIGHGVPPIGPFGDLSNPAEYADEFEAQVATRSWVNLHAVGILRDCLVVSVELPAQSSPTSGASVQLSGPEVAVARQAGWKLDQ